MGTEQVTEEDDLTSWGDQWTLEDLRRFIICLVPRFDKLIKHEHVVPMVDELAELMSGPQVVQKVTWPAVLLLLA